jgi:hypothetical protein
VEQLREIGTIRLGDAIHGAIEQLQSLLGLEVSSVTGAARTEDGWRMTIELIERKAVPDTQDLLGVYEVHLDEEGELTSYERREIRRRMDLMETVE